MKHTLHRLLACTVLTSCIQPSSELRQNAISLQYGQMAAIDLGNVLTTTTALELEFPALNTQHTQQGPWPIGIRRTGAVWQAQRPSGHCTEGEFRG